MPQFWNREQRRREVEAGGVSMLQFWNKEQRRREVQAEGVSRLQFWIREQRRKEEQGGGVSKFGHFRIESKTTDGMCNILCTCELYYVPFRFL
jgi:hypothetical protein